MADPAGDDPDLVQLGYAFGKINDGNARAKKADGGGSLEEQLGSFLGSDPPPKGKRRGGTL